MIAAIDGSTKSLGYATPEGELFTLRPSAGADDNARRLHQLAWGVEHFITHYPPRPKLVVIEGYALGAPGRLSLVRLGEVGGVLRLRLFELVIPFVEISPSTLKLYATGNGNCDKAAMVAAANEERGTPVAGHDEADAFWLRHIARAQYGLEQIDGIAHRLDALTNAGVTWPTLMEVR